MTDEDTNSGSLKKRYELQRESASLREQMAIVAHGIEAIDRALAVFRFDGDLEGKTPRATRVISFFRNELRDCLLGEHRKADGPLSSREPASMVCQCEAKNARDCRLVADVARRVSRALRKMSTTKIVQSHQNRAGAADSMPLRRVFR